MAVSASPLDPLLNEINVAAARGLPLLAVAMAVALPDICASLASDDGLTTPPRFKQWCEENLSGPEFSFITPEDFYSMRCGVLHNGRFGDLKHSVARVVFAPPGGVTLVNCRFNDAYVYSVVDFCQNITNAVTKWVAEHEADATIQANLPRLMQYRVGGMAPYITGMTVLA